MKPAPLHIGWLTEALEQPEEGGSWVLWVQALQLSNLNLGRVTAAFQPQVPHL